jgi:hypothetical protein
MKRPGVSARVRDDVALLLREGRSAVRQAEEPRRLHATRHAYFEALANMNDCNTSFKRARDKGRKETLWNLTSYWRSVCVVLKSMDPELAGLPPR